MNSLKKADHFTLTLIMRMGMAFRLPITLKRIIIPSFEIIRDGNTIKIELTENQEIHHGTQYMFMHVENDKFNYEGQTRKVLEKYKTILVYSKNPITINANDYKDKILRFHFNGYMNEIQL